METYSNIHLSIFCLQNIKYNYSDVLLANGPLTEDQVLHIALGIAKGLVFIHQNGYIHRDIKTNNILVLVNGWKGILSMV